MSWSAASSEIAESVRALLAGVSLPSLVTLEQSSPKSQFEHLRELNRHAAAAAMTPAEPPPEWVFFTDDDDIWSETRHQLFARTCHRASTSTNALCCTRKARPARIGGAGWTETGDDGEDDHQGGEAAAGTTALPPARDAPAVRALLASGDVRLTDLSRHVDCRDSSFDMDEYFDYAVRLSVLTDFFAAAPNALVKHKLCDLAFTSTLRKPGAHQRVLFTPEEEEGSGTDFVYYYDRQENACFSDGLAAGASTGVSVSDADMAVAREGQATVDAALVDVPPALSMPPERLAFFVSCLRQAIEQELVQLRVHNAAPKLRQTDEACERHVDQLLDTHPLRGTKGHAAFRRWCIQAARGPILSRLLRLLSFDPPKARR